MKAEHIPNQKRCEVCGKDFIVRGWTKNQRRCSRACWDASRRYLSDYEKAVAGRIRSRIKVHLRANTIPKDQRTFTAIGWSIADLRNHLERQFTARMTWANMGKWHIDHIVPLSSFRITSMNDQSFRDCWALTNLRPIWKRTNLRKNAKRSHLI
jgi:hypothetical protein